MNSGRDDPSGLGLKPTQHSLKVKQLSHWDNVFMKIKDLIVFMKRIVANGKKFLFHEFAVLSCPVCALTNNTTRPGLVPGYELKLLLVFLRLHKLFADYATLNPLSGSYM